VETTNPSAAGVVQDAGYPLLPSISTKQRRHEPNGSRLSVAHNLGTLKPATEAARIKEVPSGTVTSTPSILSVTSFSEFAEGVPKSFVSSIFLAFGVFKFEFCSNF
jgi:hypothetical protein